MDIKISGHIGKVSKYNLNCKIKIKTFLGTLFFSFYYILLNRRKQIVKAIHPWLCLQQLFTKWVNF